MRHNRLFAAGLAAALMLGAASPALAAPSKSKGKGHAYGQHPGTKPPKPTKKSKFGVSGGGSFGTAEFSIQARSKHGTKGHFNWTDGTLKIRCRSFADLTSPAPGTTPPPATAAVTFKNCAVSSLTQPVDITVTVIDRGQPKQTPTVITDNISFSVPGITLPATFGGDMTGGNIKIRPA